MNQRVWPGSFIILRDDRVKLNALPLCRRRFELCTIIENIPGSTVHFSMVKLLVIIISTTWSAQLIYCSNSKAFLNRCVGFSILVKVSALFLDRRTECYVVSALIQIIVDDKKLNTTN